jgi:hypothetical protein
MELLTNPFTLGLLLGLIITVFIAISAWSKRRSLVKDNRLLREHLHTQMSINAQGNQAQMEQIASLTKQNENLRISLAALKNRSDKSELRTLYLYDKSIHLMYEKAPGFAPVWESVLKEAEVEMEKTSTGLIAWVRKVICPSLAASNAQNALPLSQSRQEVQFITEHK